MKKYSFFFVCILIVASLVACQQYPLAPSQESKPSYPALSLKGKDLPDFSVTDKNGKAVTQEDVRGQLTFILEWASWCPDCQAQLPLIQELYDSYKDQVRFLAINVTDSQKEPYGQAETYMTANGYTLPYYYDEGQKTADALQVKQIPSMYLVSKKGKIEEVYLVKASKLELERAIQKYLAQD